MKTFNRTIKILSAITLFFFCWTFLPIYAAVAYAAAPEARMNPRNSSEQEVRSSEPTTGERFEKAIENIRGQINKADEKHLKGQDITTEVSEVKKQRAEIEKTDSALKKEFAATEKKLKDAKLPKEILDRHAKFVKHYEDNLAELKTNLSAIEKPSATSQERRAALQKAKAHLDRVKPPKKHIPLDPNNLPHRMVKGKERAPRLKKEEFEKDFPKQKKSTKLANMQWIQDAEYRIRDFYQGSGILNQASSAKPILLAYNDIASDIPFQLPRPSGESVGTVPEWFNRGMRGGFDPVSFAVNDFIPNSVLNTPNYQIAQAIIPPAPEDLMETLEVQFTPEIQALAAQLNHNPVKIYEWVRNNIEFVPTYGSIQGAQMTMETKLGNAFDTASLLIALLRASGISARYVYGTIEIPIDKAMNWVGGVTDPKMVGTIFATNGIPGKSLISGGTIKYIQLEHVWVEAYVPYGNYRGSMRDDSIRTWIPLDASYKQYEYKRGMDLYSAMGIIGEKYIQDYISDNSSLTIPDELQAEFPAYTISPYQYYSKRLLNYVYTNSPTATYQDVFGADTIETSKTIIIKEYPYLLGSLSYNVTVKAATFSSIPDNLRQKVSFTLENSSGYEPALSYTTSLPEIAGKRITISYDPATSTDEALIAQYGSLLGVPPYLLSVKPVIKINGVAVATGTAIGLGREQTFNMTFSAPNIDTEFVTNTVIAGDYSAIPILTYKAPATLIADDMETLIKNIGSTDLDNLLGQMLYNVGISYFHHLNFEEELYAKNFQLIITKGLSEAIVTSHAVTDSLWGVPYRITEGEIGIDVDKNVYLPFPTDGNLQRTRDFMVVSGLGSSAWEDRALQAFYDIPSVSAARLLRYASQQGVPIYTIDGNNVNTMLSELQVASEVVDDIRNAANAGKKVIISRNGVQYEGWSGIGYIVLDPATGAAAYMISGGTSGGMFAKPSISSTRTVSEYLRDGSALQTIFGRAMVVMYAMALLDTPYREKGADPETGFDCSGLVHYVFTSVYGRSMFGGKRLSASGQYEYLLIRNMTHLYDERLSGDILWSPGHTGIYYGIPIPRTTYVMDGVIHANKGEWFSSVIITSVNNASFGAHADKIGRPIPYVSIPSDPLN